MWVYEKKLQYPINIKQTNPKLAKIIISQYGGPDGELGASLRYLSQRYSVPYPEVKAVLTDIGTEECVPIRYNLIIYIRKLRINSNYKIFFVPVSSCFLDIIHMINNFF